MIEPKIFTVGQINRYIKNLLENDFILSSLLVRGEISNFKAHHSGHYYFTLKDAVGAIACVMFREDAKLMPFVPENGMQAIIYGRVSLYEKTGQYQLYAECIEPVGLGALQLAFEQRKEQLEAEGLFDADFKREIPNNPSCIAVLTSPTGAAVRDIIQIVKRRDPSVQIAVFPTLVQGEQAAEDIVRSLKLANDWGKADVIILGRGGGSMEDLWCFNEENVARAVFASEIPVISAVGHETDFTIVDFVADLRAPTPSAAAELATSSAADRKESVLRLYQRLEREMATILHTARRRLDFACQSAAMQKPLLRMQQMHTTLKQYDQTMQMHMQHILQQSVSRFDHLQKRLEASSPLSMMHRGYLLAENQKGGVVASVAQIERGDIVTLRFQDGQAQAEIIEKVVNSYGEEKSHI